MVVVVVEVVVMVLLLLWVVGFGLRGCELGGCFGRGDDYWHA